MSTIIAVVAFVAIALVGWAVAEAKDKLFIYTNNEQEEIVLEQNRKQLEKNGYTELNINDVMRTITTAGYSAV